MLTSLNKLLISDEPQEIFENDYVKTVDGDFKIVELVIYRFGHWWVYLKDNNTCSNYVTSSRFLKIVGRNIKEKK